MKNTFARLIKCATEKKVKKFGLFSINGKRLIKWRQGFLKAIALHQQRIYLADTTHLTIIISEISNFEVPL